VITTTPSPPVLTTTQRSSTVTTPLTITLPDRRNNLLKLLNESFLNSTLAEDLQFDEIFSESSKAASNPWAIDAAQFEIVPAVPSKGTPDIVRVAKEVSEDNSEKDTFMIAPVPRQFMFSPVPAVPDVTTAPDDRLARRPKNTLELSDDFDNIIEVQKNTSENNMNKEGSCIERCVQQFCLPEEGLSMFSTCVDKCQAFCL